ncbi:MAG: TIGR00159 family protein [Candidatus Peregrinibacteria bacterium GW2011_GWA2_47_7]|nr:MAG: TIGR00159 family protein [Candidatus Peregrinibacteria bacterium GW2011_GWA2_47_7]
MISAINNLIAEIILFVTSAAGTFWLNITLVDYSLWQATVDILLVAILFYWLMRLLIGTRAMNILFGLIVLGAIFLISQALKLLAISWLLHSLFTVILVAIPIIFQQELRAGLERLGRTKFFLAEKAKEIDLTINEIIEACLFMAKNHIGALIAFKMDVVLTEYIDTGVKIDARISKELLGTIFSKSAPLHDGACVIDRDRVVAAGVILPHSFKNYGHAFGTRHKAALALSESTDARSIVISEERGSISLVEDGKLEEEVTAERLQRFLQTLYRRKKVK